jgi:hypothetical protein
MEIEMGQINPFTNKYKNTFFESSGISQNPIVVFVVSEVRLKQAMNVM